MIYISTNIKAIIEFHAQPDLVIYADYADLDRLIEQLQSLKPAITDAQAEAALIA